MCLHFSQVVVASTYVFVHTKIKFTRLAELLGAALPVKTLQILGGVIS